MWIFFKFLKALKTAVLLQLQDYLESNNIFEKCKSGFGKHYSTDTALLKLLNDILLSVHSGDSVILLLLDLSAAFDTRILISRLENCVVITGCALDWLKKECFLFILMVFLHLAPSCILGFLRALFWPLFCSHYICFLWGPFLPSMGCHFISMLMTAKLICPWGKIIKEAWDHWIRVCQI